MGKLDEIYEYIQSENERRINKAIRVEKINKACSIIYSLLYVSIGAIFLYISMTLIPLIENLDTRIGTISVITVIFGFWCVNWGIK